MAATILSRAFLRVRTLAKVIGDPSRTASTGASWIRLPRSAAAPPMRPPFCRNVRLSGVKRKRVRSMASRAAWATPRRSSPASRAATASSTGNASSKPQDCESIKLPLEADVARGHRADGAQGAFVGARKAGGDEDAAHLVSGAGGILEHLFQQTAGKAGLTWGYHPPCRRYRHRTHPNPWLRPRIPCRCGSRTA